MVVDTDIITTLTMEQLQLVTVMTVHRLHLLQLQ